MRVAKVVFASIEELPIDLGDCDEVIFEALCMEMGT